MPHRPRHMRASRAARHPVLSALLWLIALGILAVMLLRYAPSFANNGRKITSVAAFIPWLAFPLALMLVPALAWRRRALTGFLALCLGLQLVWHIGYLNPLARLNSPVSQAPAQSTTDDAYLRVMTLNTQNGRADAEQIVDAVRSQQVEVLALQEVNSSLLDRLDAAGLRELLPYRVVGTVQPEDNGGVNVVFTAAPVMEANSDLIHVSSSAISAADITVNGRTLRFCSVHLASPLRGQPGFWNQGLTSLRGMSRDDGDLVLLGDFNATWDHSRFRKMLGGDFLDASEQAGEGLHMTYPANSAIPPVIEIDHVVYPRDAGITAGDLQTMEIAGTDHRALFATLHVAAE